MNSNSKSISIFQLGGILLVGVLASSYPAVISLIWLFVIVSTLAGYFQNKMEKVWYGVAASPMLEVWSRMERAPLIPYEIGKYYLLLVLLILLFQNITRKSNPAVYNVGVFIIMLLIPSLLIATSTFDRENWVFNILGTLEVGAMLLFAARERWDMDRFCKTLRAGLIPVIAVVVFLTVSTPGVSQMNFVLGANFEAAAGFGTNQVSTILGNGIVLIVILLILDFPIFKYKWISYILLAYLLFRGLLTFARGGMIGAFMCIIIATIPAMLSNIKAFARYALLISTLCLFGFVIFTVINGITNNKLLERFKGETEGTIAGKREKTINSATSGRFELMSTDLKIFSGNVLFGVGPGGAKELRMKYGAVEIIGAHTEATRLLSENGIGGGLVALLIFIFPFTWIRKQKISKWKGVSAALFTLAIFTSLHSAMRTNTTIVFYSLAAIPVMLDEYWIHKLLKS
jgi:hypothetical protein